MASTFRQDWDLFEERHSYLADWNGVNLQVELPRDDALASPDVTPLPRERSSKTRGMLREHSPDDDLPPRTLGANRGGDDSNLLLKFQSSSGAGLTVCWRRFRGYKIVAVDLSPGQPSLKVGRYLTHID